MKRLEKNVRAGQRIVISLIYREQDRRRKRHGSLPAIAQTRQKTRAIHNRHKQIQEDSGRVLFSAYSILYPLQSLLPIGDADRLVSLKDEHIGDHLLSGRMILYHKNEWALLLLALFSYLSCKRCRYLLHNMYSLYDYLLLCQAEQEEQQINYKDA